MALDKTPESVDSLISGYTESVSQFVVRSLSPTSYSPSQRGKSTEQRSSMLRPLVSFRLGSLTWLHSQSRHHKTSF